MIYIVTYATHSERYFELLQKSYPDIVVLGYGTTWKGFSDKVYATLEFCKKKNPNDIVCFVDGFDSIVLSSKEEILEKYKSFQKPLIFSKAMTPTNILYKYGQDKMFGRCNGVHLNSGMYIGTAHSILQFWDNFSETDDDQIYATKQCKISTHLMEIDSANKIFYNYSSGDDLKILNERVVINSSKPCVISAPANNNINHLLDQMRFSNLPTITMDYKYRLNTYLYLFLPEIMLLIVVFLLFTFVSNRRLAMILSAICFFEVIHYELFVKHVNSDILHKAMYVCIDLFHMSILFYVFYLLMSFQCNIKKLLFLNTLYFLILLLFFVFKRCILTIFENNVLGIDQEYGSISRETRLKYFFDMNHIYYPKKGNNTENWMNGNKVLLFCIMSLNAYCLWKITGKGKRRKN